MKNLTPRLNRLEPNIIIDGGFEIWPEGSSRSITNNTSLYGSVLILAGNTSSGITLTNSQQASVPSNTNIPFSNQVSKTAAGTLAAGTRTRLRYVIEGYDLQKLRNSEFSVIFWVKSSVASNRSLTLKQGSGTHSYVTQYNIAQANTWELKVKTFPALNSSPATFNNTNGAGATINWSIVTGSTFQTGTTNQWQAGDFESGLGEDTTWLTGTTHDFSIAGVMVLPGDFTGISASTYEFLRAGRNFQDELNMTQRYYEKSYALDVVPGTNLGASANGGSEFFSLMGGLSINNDGRWEGGRFKVRKRIAPTVTAWSVLGVENRAHNFNAGVDLGATTAQPLSISETNFMIRNLSGGTISATGPSFQLQWHWAADARF